MKILFINDQFERGGAGRVAAILCNELHRRGYDIVLVCDTQHWAKTYSIDGEIPVCEIVTKSLKPGRLEKFLKWFRCSKAIRRYIKEETPDVIIATQSMIFLCTWLANLFIGVPVIAADHTSFSRRIAPIIDFVRYHLYDRADGLSILTEKDARLLGSKFPQKRVIYNPLSFPCLDHSVTRKKNILCAGRLEVWDIKGFDIIIELWSHIHSQYPEWTLEIAGDGTQASVVYMNGLLEKHGVADRVRLLGQIDNMQQLYAESSIFALPSRMEGFPMVLMEAMSQGCACVAFSVGGASDEMLDEDSGIIINDGNVAAFQKALAWLIENAEQREIYSKNAIRSVTQFSVERFGDRWEELIQSVL